MELKFSKLGKDYVVADVDQLPAASIAYLLNYGFQQSMQDCIAGAAKAVSVELHETAAKANKPRPSDAEIAKATEDTVAGLLGKRYDAIVAGDVGLRVAAQRDPLLTLAREYVWTALRKPEHAEKAKAIRGMEKDARQAKLAELSSQFMEKNRQMLEGELARRATVQPTVEIEL